MSQKAMVFIDGGWLYRSRTTLFAKLGEVAKCKVHREFAGFHA